MKRTILLALLLGLTAGAGGADSLSSLPDPGYSEIPQPLGGTISGRIDRIVYPTIGFPSIAAYGDTIPIHFRLEQQTKVEFYVTLTRTVGPARNDVYVPVKRATFDAKWGGYLVIVEVPSTAPTGMYDLSVDVFALGLHDVQRNVIKVIDKIPDKFRFVHIADSQFGDPRGLFKPANQNAGDYDTMEILAQEIEEIRYLDPQFAVLSGDLLFGIDYEVEYEGAWNQWREAGFPVFMVAGNHDGYATTKPYKYKWLQVTPRDGLEYWRRFFGPLDYSFDFGPYHFVAMNSYDGPAARRDSMHIIVRNYGGEFTRKQLDWLEQDLARATAAGKQSIIFLHHNPHPREIKPNKPFSVEELSQDVDNYLLAGDWEGFMEKWEGSQDWNDAASSEEFLETISKNSVTHVLIGHNHVDKLGSYGNIEFITTTTLSSSSSGGYWGYRLFEAEGRTIRRVDYEGTARQSIPAGNVVLTAKDNDGEHTKAAIEIANGLSRPMEGTLEFHLRWSDSGFDVIGGKILQAVRVGNRGIVTVRATAPAGASFDAPSRTRVEVVSKTPAPPAPLPGCAGVPGVFTGPEDQGPAALGFLFWFVLVPVAVWYVGRRRSLARAA